MKMWRGIKVCFVTICWLIQAKAAPDISLDDLLERLVTLEDWKSETEKELSTLRETVTQQGVTIENLKRDLAIQSSLTAKLQSNNQDGHQDTFEHNVETEGEKVSEEGQTSDNRIRSTNINNPVPVQTSAERIKRQSPGAVAFTAYLDHDIEPGSHQTIIFNQILTNEGNGYNSNNGIFTCPKSGMYLFSFHMAERSQSQGIAQLYAELRVNDHLMVDAVAETYHQYADDQGGNTLAVRLYQGDTVWVDAGTSGYHVEGSGRVRSTTFTGVYLY